MRSRVVIAGVELLSAPRSHCGGEYVFHQKTEVSGFVFTPWATVLVETMVRMASWAGTMPPWW